MFNIIKYPLVILIILVGVICILDDHDVNGKCMGDPERMIRDQYPNAKIMNWTSKFEDGVYKYDYEFIGGVKVWHRQFACKGKYSSCVDMNNPQPPKRLIDRLPTKFTKYIIGKQQ